MGLEPTTTGITIRDSTNWATVTTELISIAGKNLMSSYDLLLSSNECIQGEDITNYYLFEVARQARLELTTARLEGGCSIQLSYWHGKK